MNKMILFVIGSYISVRYCNVYESWKKVMRISLIESGHSNNQSKRLCILNMLLSIWFLLTMVRFGSNAVFFNSEHGHLYGHTLTSIGPTARVFLMAMVIATFQCSLYRMANIRATHKSLLNVLQIIRKIMDENEADESNMKVRTIRILFTVAVTGTGSFSCFCLTFVARVTQVRFARILFERAFVRDSIQEHNAIRIVKIGLSKVEILIFFQSTSKMCFSRFPHWS